MAESVITPHRGLECLRGLAARRGGGVMLVDTDHLLPIGEAASKGISRLAAEAESGHDYVLLRNSRPVAAVVGVDKLERLQRLESAEEDLRLLALALARFVTDKGQRVGFDAVLERFGLTEADLDEVDDE
jgi:antitoxin (DNA-binding transcriptional repressor) of toxin-antitoxin stability system